MDKKLTDSEIVKALEEWIKNYDGSYVNFKTLGLALDLINRLQAENERLLQELQLMSEENIVHCKECKHLMFSDFEGECSKGYKGIVRPNDSCPFGKKKKGEKTNDKERT